MRSTAGGADGPGSEIEDSTDADPAVGEEVGLWRVRSSEIPDDDF